LHSFPLYAASKAVVARYAPFLGEIGLTYTQYITMMVLWEVKTIGVKELGGRRRFWIRSGNKVESLRGDLILRTKFQTV
jgi:hypothetical protein